MPAGLPTLRRQLGESADRLLLECRRLRWLQAATGGPDAPSQGPEHRSLDNLIAQAEGAAHGLRGLSHPAKASEVALGLPLFTRDALARPAALPEHLDPESARRAPHTAS